MGFKKHTRIDWGVTARSRQMNCTKCGKEIKIGDEFYIKTYHRNYGKNSTEPMCVDCYESMFIQVGN